MKTVGVDIGATKIAAGLVDQDGNLLDQKQQPTPPDPNQGIETIAALVKSYLEQGATVLGVGTPGPIDFATGTILNSPNLPGWRNFPLQKSLQQKLSIPVAMENDAHVALLGEIWQGAGKGKDPVVMLTLGTGVGGALWHEGNLWHGDDGRGAELGHVMVNPDFNGVCQAGHRGCLEAMAGGVSVKKWFGKDIKELFGSGSPAEQDLAARDARQQWTDYLKLGVTKLRDAYHPQLIIIGGGVSNDADKFLPQLRDAGLPVVTAQLGSRAGIIGAAYLALKSSGSLNS